MWEPGDTSPTGLIEAAQELGELHVERADLLREWTTLFHEGVANAVNDNPAFGDVALKTFGGQYVAQKNPELHNRLIEVEGRIDAIVATATVLRSVAGTTRDAQSAGMTRLFVGQAIEG